MHKKEDPISTSNSSQYTDPTYNVLQLVNAAVKRLDDLSASERHATKEMISLNKEIIDLHVSNIKELIAKDIFYIKELSYAESKRIDAIRAVDVGAVAIASERAVGQATVLANQLAASADILRTLVSTTAATTQTQVINPLIERIALLEKSQYEGVGKGRVTDPQMSQLLDEVRALREARSNTSGKLSGAQMLWAAIAAVLGLALIGIQIYNSVHK